MSALLLFQVLGVLSLLTFFGSLLAVPWLINRMPSDYFQRHWRQLAAKQREHPARALALLIGRNMLGLALVAAGVAMLFLPGQGVLTILIGVCVMNFPGKQRLLQQVVKKKRVQRTLNWVRRKGGRPPFRFS